ncbi:DUF4145 domain-containing protein [Rubrivivax gelatinosus]|uniref:DUF4145 domain-containing protein n=1 Tax=Rubrivivax gelatinosus TaxID=28068 RepID=UPI001051C4FD|nr:DUF4145 domain-containing protein [Rubrivivax gelatinosus]MBK1689349.1 hypothetical protein [Rubrivivax gelatinosus]
MNYVAPEITIEAFHCPFCGTYAHMDWAWLVNRQAITKYLEATCSRCRKASLWLAYDTKNVHGNLKPNSGEMVYPDFGTAPLPEVDMPEDVVRDYCEAARIFSKSPRGAAALLRLGLQKLCRHLGEEGVNINEDIRSLAAKNTIPPLVVKVADTVRITGNNAVHPGEMCDDDFDHIASKMFELLNFVVKKGISEPRELEALYSMVPEGARKKAEIRDEKAKLSARG